MSVSLERIHAFDEARKAGREPYKVKDLTLAEFGRKEIRLAEQEMPGLMAIRSRYAGKNPACVREITITTIPAKINAVRTAAEAISFPLPISS